MTKVNYTKESLFIFILLLLNGCGFVGEDGDIPAFININSAEVVNNTIAQTSNIKDMWVFVDGIELGLYEMPSDIPIILNGEEQSIKMLAGIRNNGIKANPVFYPFYTSYDIERTYQELDRDTIYPIFDYKNETIFSIDDEFEGTTVFNHEIDQDSSSYFSISAEQAASGNKSGKLLVTASAATLEIVSDVNITDLPINGSAIYAEIDYRGNTDLLVGLYGKIGNTFAKQYLVVLKPQDKWNKVYIDLSLAVAESQLDNYNILLGIKHQGEPEENGVVYVDNIRLLHF